MFSERVEMPSCMNCAKRFNNLFCNSRFDTMSEINLNKECSHYNKGEYIFKTGHTPFGVFCINRGKVKVVRQGDDGREHIVRFAKPGDPLGYRSLLSGERYASSAVAMEDSNICFMPKELFMGVLQKDGDLTMEMMKLLGSDLKRAEEFITNLAQKNVRERMASALLLLRETYGLEADGETIAAAFSREDLANFVGTATETAIRILSEFNKEKVIGIKGKQISIPDLHKLVKVSGVTD